MKSAQVAPSHGPGIFTQKVREESRERFSALMGLVYDPEGPHASFERVPAVLVEPLSALGLFPYLAVASESQATSDLS